MKQCRKCLINKSYDDFHKNKQTKDGHAVYCKACKSLLDKQWMADNPKAVEKRRHRSRQWQKNNPEKYKAGLRKWKDENQEHKWSLDKKSHLWTHYRITVDDFIRMHNEQGGACAICDRHKKLVVDHDHSCCPGKISCGKCVRSLICFRCNSLLGLSQDSPILLQRAIDYLQDN